MAAAPVSLLPNLRPWQRAGVEFLLTEQNLPAPWSLCIAAPPPMPARNAPARPATRERPVSAASARPHESAARQANSVRQDESALRQAPAVSVSAGPPPEQWPSIWQERLRKTAPAVVLWTYWALGEDLCLRPDPARRALLKKLLGDLGHPAGTHSFWPAALPAALPASGAPQDGDAEESGLHANPEIFWAGVQTLKARALVVMGSAALKALNLPPRLRPFQQTRHQGRLIVVLRDVDFLAKEDHRYDAVREFLKQALAPFGRL